MSLKITEIKGIVKKRDGYNCQVCNTNEDLQVHHILPAWKYRNKKYDLDNLITLCRTCHMRVQVFNKKHNVYVRPYKNMFK